MIQKMFRQLLSVLLAAVMLLQPLAVFAEEEEDPVTHIGRATVALKVRRAPDKNAFGCGSISRGDAVYVIEYGNEWCRVRTSRTEGYVMTKYLADLQQQEGVEIKAKEEKAADIPAGELMAGFTTNETNFHEGYYAHTVQRALIYDKPDETSRIMADVPIYEQLVVSEVAGDWALVRYKGRYYGYMRTDSLFKWDRIDPYVGDIPGLEVWPLMIFTNKTANVYDWNTHEVLKTVNPGAAICANEKDGQGRYLVPYERVDGYIREEDVAWAMPVVPYEEAQSGDLISVMTTFFAVGKSSLQYQGRNWNIRLAGDYISGTVLQPGQDYNMNNTIGPYRKSTGYKSAPIMSDKATSGYGGGTCQVNTTFYIATIQVPLLVTHRRVHANVGMYYAEKGFDAAVGGGDINLRMTNTLPYAIRYHCLISDGVLTICIYRD